MPQCAPRTEMRNHYSPMSQPRWGRRAWHTRPVMTFDGSELTPGAFHKLLQGDR
jgi:hypothetical protein